MDPTKRLDFLSDRRQIYTLISNLVVNAIEASPESGTVCLRITTTPVLTLAIHNSGAVPATVRDTFF